MRKADIKVGGEYMTSRGRGTVNAITGSDIDITLSTDDPFVSPASRGKRERFSSRDIWRSWEEEAASRQVQDMWDRQAGALEAAGGDGTCVLSPHRLAENPQFEIRMTPEAFARLLARVAPAAPPPSALGELLGSDTHATDNVSS